MIINGNPAGSVSFWSKHLLRDDTNEKAEVREISGLSATDLQGALKEMQAVASGSRCKGNFMYQANINPLAHEKLSPEQWREAVDTLEKNLGLTGHQRVVVEHVKEGRQHVHIIWNRVDVETMRVADMGGNWRTHVETARELEKKFGLTPTRTAEPHERKRPDDLWEKRASERSGVNIGGMRRELTGIWQRTDSGAAFKAAIEEQGYILAKGDRRDFCVVDRAGDVHSLARRLDGVKAADVRARMSDIDRNSLPSVEVAREIQRSKPQQEKPRVETPKYDIPRREKPSAAREGIRVTNAFTGASESLVDFVGRILGDATASEREPYRDQVERMIANGKAQAALDNIRERLGRGEGLGPEDVMNLTREHLENIKAKGDSYLYGVIARMESEQRERDDERGRYRDR